MKATLSGPAQAGEGALWASGGRVASSYSLRLYASRWPTLPQHIESLLSLLGLRTGHTGQEILQGGRVGEQRKRTSGESRQCKGRGWERRGPESEEG